MARATPKKLKSADSPSSSKGNGSILSFFARTLSDSVANGGASGINGGASSSRNAARNVVRRASGTNAGEDVKPTLGTAGRRASQSRQGKEKVGDVLGGWGKADSGQGVGSVDDPMVISDEEDAGIPSCAAPRLGKQDTHTSAGSEQDRKRRPKMPAGKATSDFGQWDIDIQMTDTPGPSRSRSRTRSQSPAHITEASPTATGRAGPAPPFAGMPHFQPPPTWPQIVNTADMGDGEGEDEAMLVDDCGLPARGADTDKEVSSDGNANHGDGVGSPGEGEERQRGGSDDDDDSIADRSEGSHADDGDSGDQVDGEEDAGEIELLEPEDPEDHQLTVQSHTIRASETDTADSDPAETIHQPFAGLDMEWGDDADEGMGMDDFGEEEGLDLDEPAAGVLGKRKDKASATAKKGSYGAGGCKGDNIDKCPVCDKSLKGKSEALVQKHINTCLDTCSSSPAKGGNKSSKAASRPISSFAPLSPAPSPSPSPEPEVSTGNGGSNGPSKGPNAFSVLMSGHKEREQWKDAEIDLKRDGKRTFGRRKAPFYKVMTGMPVAVDAFRYGAIPKVTAYLLTHAHSDHYTNLSKSWNHGPIYCSQTTANLVVHMLGVEPQWVHGLPDNVPFVMPNTGGVKVTNIEANHCPGSSIFLFEGPQTVNAGDSGFKSPYVGSKRLFRYLHCGDFRACPKMVLHPEISRARIDTCYLDTTYLNPKYCFPPQPQVIEACAQLARKTVLGLPDNAPPLRDVKPPVFDLIKAEYNADAKSEPGVGATDREGGEEADVKPNKEALKYEPGLAEIEAEERGKAMMKGWLVNKEDTEAIKQEGGGDDGVNVEREGGEELVKVEQGSVHDDKSKAQSQTAGQAPKKKGRTLVVMGTYSIGKERIVKAVAEALGTTIYCDPRKRGILLCQTDPDLHALLSTDPISSHVHLLPLGNIQLDRMQEYLVRLHPHFDRVLGFRPTGWSYSPPAGTDMMPDVNTVIRRDQARWFTDASLKPMRGSCRQYMMYGVPYSEHSSFFELSCFALSMPGPDLRMIATVNVGNEKGRAKMKKWFEKWLAEKARRKEKNLPAVVDYRDITYDRVSRSRLVK